MGAKYTRFFLDYRKSQDDERFVPPNKLLKNDYQRYQHPFVLTETSHPKEDRPEWIEMIVEQSALTLAAELPLWGVCWYPILNRPDWDNLDDWYYSGLWEDRYSASETQARIPHIPTA